MHPDPVIAHWLGRAAAEYHSGVQAAWVAHQLMLVGAPPALVRRGMRVASDEMTHAAGAIAVARAAGFRDALELDRTSLVARVPVQTSAVEVALVQVVAVEFCIAETAAARVLGAALREAKVPAARKVLRKYVTDEIRHREFAWLSLAWLVHHDQGLAAAAQAAAVAWWDSGNAKRNGRPAAPMPEELRAWGLLDPSEQAAQLTRALEVDVAPAFRELGVDIAFE